MGRLSPFQCLVLDKFEGALAGDLLDLRRYPDATDARVLLQHAACELVVFEGNDLERGKLAGTRAFILTGARWTLQPWVG